MKKFFIISVLLIFGLRADASFIFESNVNMNNYWQKTGIDVQKVLDIGSKFVNANKLDKYVVIKVINSPKTVNAYTSFNDKSVNIYSGMLSYIDSDDELAFIIGHEIGHALDYYESPFRVVSMIVNEKSYETKADLVSIDMMVKAGYNPIAAISMMYKISGEDFWADWIFFSHPKGTVRMLNMYKYIYKKYPAALESEMTKNINYQNFLNAEKKDIDAFLQDEKFRLKNRSENL